MADRPALSKAELEVARIVWRLGGATVRQVHEQMPETRVVEYKTVQTYLRRLEAKGYLSAKRQGRSTYYTQRVRAGKVIRETVDDFVNRLFDGEALPLMEHLIREQGLEQTDIDRLRELLDQLEADSDESSC